MANKFNTKKWLQVGAYATDALSKGSAGGLGRAIVEADVDLSGKSTTGNQTNGDTKKNGRKRNVQIENGDSRLEANETDWPPKGKKGWIA